MNFKSKVYVYLILVEFYPGHKGWQGGIETQKKIHLND